METVAIVAIVERGRADALVKVARVTGATGATIFYARGTDTSNLQRLFKVQVEAEKEVILILAEEYSAHGILRAIVEAGGLEEPGKGIAFTFSVRDLIGLSYRSGDMRSGTPGGVSEPGYVS